MWKKKKDASKISRQLFNYNNPRSYVAEQFRSLRTNIKFSSIDKNIRSIIITSAEPAEGKSTIAANLAIVFAQDGKKVLLIDADMRKPTMHYTFQIKNIRGLSNVLSQQTKFEAAVKQIAVDGVDLLTCGTLPPNPAELLGAKSLESFIAHAYEVYDLLIFDAPPILSFADGSLLANKCDAALLVVNSGKTEREKAIKAKELIESSNCRLLGAVLNNYSIATDNAYYQVER